MLLLVGLGNPGPKYENHRHNVGFMAVDAIVRRHSFQSWRARFHALVAEGSLGGHKVLAIKPTTFVNESGQAVGEAMRWYKLDPAHVLVIHDELDLAPDKVRVRLGGGFAGHNGLKSIAAHIGPDFHRLRVGIGHPGDKDKVHGHVLSDFAGVDRPLLEKTIDAIAEAAPMLAAPDEHDNFMTRVALLTKPQRPKPPRPDSADGESEVEPENGV